MTIRNWSKVLPWLSFSLRCFRWLSLVSKLIKKIYHLKLVASLSHQKKFKLRQKNTSIVLLCIATQFSGETNIAEVINAIAISAFFSHSIYKNWFWDCNHFNCYVNNNSRYLLLQTHFVLQSRMRQTAPATKLNVFAWKLDRKKKN